MRAGFVGAFLVCFSVSCSGLLEDSVLQLSSQESLAEGKRLMELEKYRAASPYLLHAFEIGPNTLEGREGLLLAADSFFKAGGFGNLVKSQARYRDFLNRFPTSEDAVYAQFQIGASMAGRMDKPDRDQSLSTEALQAFRDVQRFYPTSEYVELAQVEIEKVRNHLARHEVIVGYFYLRFQRRGTAQASIDRLEGVLEDYPEFDEMDRVLLYLCRAYATGSTPELEEKAAATCQRLRDEYPESPHLKKIPKNIGS